MKDLSTEISKSSVWIPVNPALMKNKDYFPQAMGVFCNYADRNVLTRADFSKALSYCFGWSAYKINKTIDTLESLGLICDYQDNIVYLPALEDETEKTYVHGFYLHQIVEDDMDWKIDNFRITNIKINTEFLFDLFDELDDISIKLLLFFIMQDDFSTNVLHRKYSFCIRGKAGLMSSLGYAQSNDTAKKMTERLEKLRDMEYIRYTSPRKAYTRFGKPVGSYMELVDVYKWRDSGYINVQIPAETYESVKKIVEEYEGKSK